MMEQMDRRTALKLSGLGVLASRLAVAQHQMHSLEAQPADYKLQFFSAAENAVLDLVAETILPADEHSGGARAARVSYYIDLVAANSDGETQRRWREVVRRFDGFDKLGAKERGEMLERLHGSGDSFFADVRRATIFAYYSSRVGLIEELGYEGNQALTGFPGCGG
jgi:hypothetical protein